MNRWTVREEQPADMAAIAALTQAAFDSAPHASGTESAILDRLRAAGDLALSLVLLDAEAEIVGHAAFSPVTISDATAGWFGLGPVSVAPFRQRTGIGSAVIRAGIHRLRENGARGCVVLGDPDYYGRFGFRHEPQLIYPEVPPEYFQALVFAGPAPQGTVSYAPAFG